MAAPEEERPAAPEERGVARGYARARARDEAVRAQLEPLAPGERPRALTVAAIVAAVIGTANLVLLAAGWEVEGQDPSTLGTLVFTGIMLAAAVGLWLRRYLAVLAFEALLALGVTYAGLSLLVAGNPAAVLLCLTVMIGGGWLFWKLVRVLARIQAGTRRADRPGA